MIAGIGTDIVKISRMEESLDKLGDRFAKRILSDEEMKEFSRSSSPAFFLAKRFAAKEATVKALGTGFSRGISMKHVSVEHDEMGKPLIKLTQVAERIANEQEITQCHISIADEREFAIAYVIMEKN